MNSSYILYNIVCKKSNYFLRVHKKLTLRFGFLYTIFAIGCVFVEPVAKIVCVQVLDKKCRMWYNKTIGNYPRLHYELR